MVSKIVSPSMLYQTYRPMRLALCLPCCIMFILYSCSTANPVAGTNTASEADTAIVVLTKWQGNHTAAFTITSDHAWGYMEPWEVWFRRVIADSALPVDVDFTSSFIYSPLQTTCLTDTLLPIGCGVFAHGHLHVNTDTMTYNEALQNFRLCAEKLRALGIAPRVYAYPGGYGHNPTTRQAARDAGYLAARMFSPLESPYIAPDSALQPEDWYRLPTLAMFSRAAHDTDPLLKNATNLIHNTRELIPFLDGALARRAWLMATYHAINRPWNNTYETDDFLRDVAAAHARDLWMVSYNTATLYLYERSRARLETTHNRDSAGRLQSIVLRVEDGLADDVFAVPLTLLITLPESWNGKQIRALQGTTNLPVIIAKGTMQSSVRTRRTQVMLNILPNSIPVTVQTE
jgi:peptidoglycan/xylan/chitin deacetylase (PgdA/CDA1 family)